MWKRFACTLRCPLCRGTLGLSVFEEEQVAPAPAFVELARRRGLLDTDFSTCVLNGLLVCTRCSLDYPIIRGLPVMVLYRTAAHRDFLAHLGDQPAGVKRPVRFADRQPEPGERFVMESFSREWNAYRYDGVLWKTSYQDQEATFLREIGSPPRDALWSLEVGCGIGIMTSLAQRHFEVDAVGVDLSLAALQASEHFRDNPFLHFVQASAFHLPFAKETFDIGYSRGVLHHTYSTRAAFEAIAPTCKQGGLMYLWVYGTQSIKASPFRRAAYALERLTRPVLARAPGSLPATAFLSVAAVGYVAFNRLQRWRYPGIQRYDFNRGLHAARDRFTPRFAHRHPPEEVASWFSAAGFGEVEVVDWRIMPAAEQENFRRNVGVRGRYGPIRAVSTTASSNTS